MQDYIEIINKNKERFSKHKLTIIHESEKVKRYQYRRPDSGCYGFSLTCADNLIVMNGDCYSLLIEPGYGRDGLAFLRGSVSSVGYFLGKSPSRNGIREYSPEYALELIKDYYKEYLEKELDEEDLPYEFDHDGIWGEVAYYKFCNDKEIDDPCIPEVYTSTTLNQVAGLQCFVEAYEEKQ